MLSLPDFREKHVVISFAREGQKVSFKNDNLIIIDKEGVVVLQTTCHKIFSLWIIGSTTITSGLLERSKKFGFSIYMLSYSNRLYGMWNSAVEGNFLLRQKQYEYGQLEIAKHIVGCKIENQQALLKTIRKKEWDQKEAVEKLGEYRLQAIEAKELKQLLGIEGVAARTYFGAWYKNMGWKGRKPRTKVDFINTTLDIGSTYLFNIIESMLNLYGFDLYKGVYHQNFYQRKSLVCDLVEPFRCIVDKQVKKAYGLKQLKEDDFYVKNGKCLLKIQKNKVYTQWLIKSLLEHKEAMFSYTQDYYRCFIRSKPISEYPSFSLINN